MCDEILRIKELYNLDVKLFKEELRVSKVRKTTENYIVGKIDVVNETFENGHWTYEVGFHFREALDIYWKDFYKSIETFNENNEKESKLVLHRSGFVEGPFLNFKCGDSFYHRNGGFAIQIETATPVSYDQKNERINEGWIVFFEYSIKNKLFTKINLEEKRQCTQLEFLEFLITGEKSFL